MANVLQSLRQEGDWRRSPEARAYRLKQTREWWARQPEAIEWRRELDQIFRNNAWVFENGVALALRTDPVV